MGKQSKVYSAIEWRLEENVVLQPIECLTPTVKCDIFIFISHLFICRPTLELTTFEEQVCSTMQMYYHWEETTAKKRTLPLWIVQLKQESSATLAVVN